MDEAGHDEGVTSPPAPRLRRRRPRADEVRTVVVDGRERRYLLHVPADPATDRQAPLLLAFHPGYATAAGFARTTGLSARADRSGYVVAYPEGIQRSWNAGDCCGPPMRDGVDDVAFALAVVEDVAGVAPVDRDLVFATGFSNGAGLVLLLGCRAADRIRAIAVGGSSLHVPVADCHPSRPVPILFFHGLADPAASLRGGHRDREEPRRPAAGPRGRRPVARGQRRPADRLPAAGRRRPRRDQRRRAGRGHAVHGRGTGTPLARR